ncbi:aspartate/glutamate racemase family protein [Azohydromonas aeria]|uniref:aspartate/glutamate racemase family protein n=1 Tax=Azohydromonas aeria TaxID=2590212 RepID=UPI0012FCA357|nr:aspartate/glutamate racemase family protein [Azohydromonas aeria]
MSADTAAAPRIALIHAVYVAMAPVEAAFQADWPQARRVNLVDDALPADLERDGELTPAMHARIRRLAAHAIDGGADAVLFTCSAFGEAIAAAAAVLPVPVLKPNEAMFEAALGAGRRIGMLATFAAAVPQMEEEFRAMARERGVDATLEVLCLPEALAAAKAGDMATHDRLHVEAAPRLAHCDAVMLAHFSNSRAQAAVQAVLPCPVLSAPAAAIEALKVRLGLSG